MSFLMSAVPAQAMTVYARPFLGLGAFVAVLMVFKPLAFGLLRAAWVAIKPRQSFEQRLLQRRLQGASMLQRLARKYEVSQPNLAAELRCLAGRD